MPELPDVELYVHALERRVRGEVLRGIRLVNPFLLRTVAPPLEAAAGRRVEQVRRLGKRIDLVLEDDLHLVLHLMIAGRLHWRASGAGGKRRGALACFDFERGTLELTEAGSQRRAALHAVAGREGLAALDRGGLEPLEAGLEEFRAALRRENHTLKRALTDPRLFAGIGNAYSDEILHAARLAPTALSQKLTEEQCARLFAAVQATLRRWVERLREECGAGFPEQVSAFRPGMAVHGRFGQPCPDCGAPVQRIVHGERETNYCARCQTGGRLLADRALSRLLREDWPRTLEEWERE